MQRAVRRGRGDAMTRITLSRQRHGLLADCLAERAVPVARSPRFTIYDVGRDRSARAAVADPYDLVVVHDFAPSEIDNNIGHYVVEELLPLLIPLHRSVVDHTVSEQDLFELYVGEVVRSMDGDERRAWHLFYDNSLAALARAGRRNGGGTGSPAPQDFIADFAAIYRRVADLVAEVSAASVLDAGTCFGFLPMLLATGAWTRGSTNGGRPRHIVACDLNRALVSLATDYVQTRQVTGVRFVEADVLATDLERELAPAGQSFEVVTAIHFLEHLEPAQTGPALDALWSLTGRRLIVAVPVEAVPDPSFGHRQVFDQESLGALGQRTGGHCRCIEDHGAWLVVDRAAERTIQRKRCA